jgi:osmotically-inducible protein OsmY
MKIKILAVMVLGAFIFLSGCRGDSNANTANTRTNASANNTTVVTTTATATPAATRDTATEAVVKDALTKKGFKDITVEATTTGVTLRGSVAKDKMAEAVQTAQEAGRKPVKNELSGK